MADLVARLAEGAGAAVITEEALFRDFDDRLYQWVEKQPAWSDFPFVVLTSQSAPPGHPRRIQLLAALKNVSLLERPLHAATLVSAVRSALRARQRQYEVREHLLERDAMTKKLESLVKARTKELETTNQRLHTEMAERERSEMALRQLQKMEAIGLLSGGIAHDFNNLLGAILGNLQLLRKRFAGDKSTAGLIKGAIMGAERGASLTKRLLAFARRQELNPVAVNIGDLVDGLVDMLRRSIGPTIEVETELPGDLWPAFVDSNQIELALFNLAVNARDAMPEGGRLTLKARNAVVTTSFGTELHRESSSVYP